MPSMTSTSTTSPSSFSTMYWAAVAPTLPAPTTVILGRAAIRSPFRARSPGGLGGVERRAGPEPRDLLAGHAVPELQLLGTSVGLLDPDRHRLAGLEPGEADDRDPVTLLEPLVVRRGLERQRQDPLLLEVRLGDPGKAAHHDHRAAKVAGGHRRVLAAGALAVVLVPDRDPPLAGRLHGPRGLGEVLVGLAGERVHTLAGGAGEGVDRAQEHVVAD